MTNPSDTIAKTDTKREALWMVTRPRVGDVLVRWEYLMPAEQEDAHRQHDRIHGVES